MAEYTSSIKTILWIIVIVVAISLVVGIIAYNIGLYQALQSPTINTTVTNTNEDLGNNDLTNIPNNNSNITNTNIAEPIGEDVTATENNSELEGSISKITSDGFTLTAATNYYNPVLKQNVTKTKDYNIVINKQTKITETVYQVTIPPGGGMVQTKSTVKILRSTDLKVGMKVDVIIANKITDAKLTATEIKTTTTIKK